MAFSCSASTTSVSTAGPRFWEQFSDARKKAPKSECIHRVGPASREDVANADRTADIGTLDSDVEEDDVRGKAITLRTRRAAGSRALIIYFSKLAKKSSAETIDYRFLDSLFKSGAKVNARDKHGQTAMYEVVRNWNVDVARFFMRHGAEVNHRDKMGRTPLHLAAAVNHFDMVEFLIQNGGDINAVTTGEGQSPIHYAAKYNAVASLKVMIENKANINARDYKNRTPMFLAAEMAREETTRYLIDFGAPVGVFDDTGMSAIGCMVEKMPHVALDALDQFRETDPAFRKDYFYLNYLEYDPKKWRDENVTKDEYGVSIQLTKKEKKKAKRDKMLACPTTALHLAVEHNDVDIIMHPVIQTLIKQKWKTFGRFGAIAGVSIHFLYLMIWTWLGIFLPKDGKYYDEGIGWKLFLEIVGVLLTFYFIIKQIWESQVKLKENQNFRMWKTRQINRDLEYCHPRWAQEKVFLESERESIHNGGGGLLSDPWNVLEIITYILVLVVISTRLAYVFVKSEKTNDIHRKTYATFLIFMWLHFMKSCRPFTTLGPFITMLEHVMMDTVKFAFLFFEFFIPYTVGFWILFGGPLHAKKMKDEGEEHVDWEKFYDLVFSVWQVTLNVDFNMGGLYAVNRLMTQIMVGSFFALSTTLCLNLYIAMLSETFNLVYQHAKANASLLQANTILQVEKALSKTRRMKALDYIQEECGPLEQPQEEDEAGVTEKELWDKVIRTVLTKFTKLNDILQIRFGLGTQKAGVVKLADQMARLKYEEEKETYELYQILLARDRELHHLLLDIYELKCSVLTYLGEGNFLPPRPLYKNMPQLDIRPPHPLPPVPHITITKQDSVRNDNKLFRTILEGRITSDTPESQQLSSPAYSGSPVRTIDFALTDSWEDLPHLLEKDGTVYDEMLP